MNQPKYVIEDIKENLARNRERFYQSIEQKVLPKIQRDIDTIIQNGWADSVSPEDLFHCHLNIDWFYPVDKKGYDRLLSGEDVHLLYHSREFQQNTLDRNIVADLDSEPRTINGKKTLTPGDLKQWQAATVYFGLTDEDLHNCTPATLERVLKFDKYHVGISVGF